MLQIWPASGTFDGRTRTLAKSLAAQAAIALENARLHRIVQRQAITDELTELANRRYFMETLDTEFDAPSVSSESLGLVFADLDDFKLVNDRYGHQVGDEVLKRVRGLLRNRVRAIDLAARLGGEEFAVLLVETDLRGRGARGKPARGGLDTRRARRRQRERHRSPRASASPPIRRLRRRRICSRRPTSRSTGRSARARIE